MSGSLDGGMGMPRVFLRVWLVVWVMTLPFVHIHPEADHAHGMPGHMHGGTFHTVLSSTPICAYEDHHHPHSFAPGEAFGTPHSSSHPGLEHFTWSFSVLAPSIDCGSEKVECPQDSLLTDARTSSGVSSVSHANISLQKRLPDIFSTARSPRGPPVLSV